MPLDDVGARSRVLVGVPERLEATLALQPTVERRLGQSVISPIIAGLHGAVIEADGDAGQHFAAG
jgi:hypothetical protein